jgi:hypothetical protein
MLLKQIITQSALFALLAQPALAADQIAINYDITLGGARIMKASYDASIDAKTYKADFNAKTVGMSKLFSKVKLDLSASGAIAPDGLKPKRFRYERQKDGKARKRQVAFNVDGIVVTKGAKYKPAVEKALAGNVLDPVSIVSAIGASKTPCDVSFRTFDGQDVIDLKSSPKSQTGNLIVCSLTSMPIAGKDVEDGDAKRSTYQMTLVKLADGTNVLVELTGTSSGVGFSVAATSVSFNGKEVNY